MHTLMHTLQLNEAEAITQVSVITAVTTELDSVDISIAVEIITRPNIIAEAATNPDVCAEYVSMACIRYCDCHRNGTDKS